MEEFPSNAHSKGPAPKKKDEERRVEKVISGEVVRRKQPLGKRFMENMFTGADAKTAIETTLLDTVLPGLRDVIYDSIVGGARAMIFDGSRRGSSRGPSRSSSSTGTWTSYGDRFKKITNEPPISRQARANHQFDEIVIDSRHEADRVLDSLYDLANMFGSVTVADFYGLVGISESHVDRNYGWDDLRGSEIKRIREGYILDLPKPRPLK